MIACELDFTPTGTVKGTWGPTGAIEPQVTTGKERPTTDVVGQRVRNELFVVAALLKLFTARDIGTQSSERLMFCGLTNGGWDMLPDNDVERHADDEDSDICVGAFGNWTAPFSG